jgi:hypothetical protein
MGDCPRRLESLAQKNGYGGFFQPGRKYELRDKLRVAEIVGDEEERYFPAPVNATRVARRAQVGWHFAKKVMDELELGGVVLDPAFHKPDKGDKKVCGELGKVHEFFLLALRAEKPRRSNLQYVGLLRDTFGVEISTSSISNFVLKRFTFAGKFRVPNLVPLDKFKVGNKARYYEFLAKVNLLSDHGR